jgi:dihydrodipicolinate synthase/N-acetylneuraminate lyase
MITVKEAKEKMNGVVIPLATIFKDDLTVDVDATQKNVQWIIHEGAKPGNTVFIAVGSGGDFTVMTTEERKSTIKAIAEVAVPNKIPTFASVQSTDIRTTIELSQLCEEVGIDIVQMSSAFYYDVKKGDIIKWVNEVSQHTSVGFAAYSHWYSGSKYDMTMDVAEELLKVPNTVAVKWGSPNIANYLAGINYFVPRAAVVNNGPLGIYGHQLGVKAWVSHVPNFLPQHSWKVHELMTAGDYPSAQKVFNDFNVEYSKIRASISSHTAGEGIFVKPFMEYLGRPSGPSRLPSRDEVVTQEIKLKIKALLDRTVKAI